MSLENNNHLKSGSGIGKDGCQADGIECNLACVHGQCLIQSGTPKCLCYNGYDGELCDHSADPCLENPCQNGGVCLSSSNGYTCNCQPEWTGKSCEQPIGECGGSFTDAIGSLAYPGGGNTYPKNAKCTWTILAAPGSIIQLTFTKFDLEAKIGQTCHDRVDVFDGVSGKHSFLETRKKGIFVTLKSLLVFKCLKFVKKYLRVFLNIP